MADDSGVTGILFQCHIPSPAQPRPEINKKVAFDATFLFIFVELGFKRQNSFVMFERFPRSTQCVGCGAFVTILLRNTCKIYSLSPRPKIKTLISGIFLSKILDSYILCVTVHLQLKLGV